MSGRTKEAHVLHAFLVSAALSGIVAGATTQAAASGLTVTNDPALQLKAIGTPAVPPGFGGPGGVQLSRRYCGHCRRHCRRHCHRSCRRA
jgi:hypothetical protein